MHHSYESQPRIHPIPRRRVIEKLDWYMSRRDYAGAERHLLYWLEEARLGDDLRGALMLRNELVGHYRKTGNREKALESGEAALKLLGRLDLVGSITAGTTYVNLATALNAFGENERALALFERARRIYESSAATRPELLGGLYNNMGLTCAALGRYDEAEALYDRAVTHMLTLPRGGDPLDPAAWSKSPVPVMVTEEKNGLYGPGHNSFTKDDAGKDILVFHARPYPGFEGDALSDPTGIVS